MANLMKVTAQGWIDAARDALIRDGIRGVRANRLAKHLGVTRGGFYYHFRDQQDLLDRLLEYWSSTNEFLPEVDELNSPEEAVAYLDRSVAKLILEERFSPDFDQAIREWARVDPKAKQKVDEADQVRLERLTKTFCALGCDAEEAPIRAKVLYFHQMGFYALGQHAEQSREERLASAPVYVRILCGRRYLEAAGDVAKKWL